ncbi:MAG: hypothetical protein WCJ84_03485 [Candidatus Peregrinibacteria bacterium]
MKLSPDGSPFSFSLAVSTGTIGINNTKGSLFSVFLQEQAEDQEKYFHIPGEYEKADIAAYLIHMGAKYFLGKLYAEEVHIAFFSSEGATLPENVDEVFGEVDILVFEKSPEGISDSEAKKMLEKIDPRIVVFSKDSLDFAKKSGFVVEAVETLSFTRVSLPMEKTEFYVMG